VPDGSAVCGSSCSGFHFSRGKVRKIVVEECSFHLAEYPGIARRLPSGPHPPRVHVTLHLRLAPQEAETPDRHGAALVVG